MKTFLHLVLALVAAAPFVSASPVVFRLADDPQNMYRNVDVGPDTATLTHSLGTVFFCLDGDLGVTFDTNYSGTITSPTGEKQTEAAFLAGYAIWQASVHNYLDPVAELYGPTSFAIWQIMGTLNGRPEDPAAQALVEMAENAYANGLIPATFASHVSIFNPSNTSVQRFITVYCDTNVLTAASQLSSSAANAQAPEPATFAMIGGALMVLFARYMRTRMSPVTASAGKA